MLYDIMLYNIIVYDIMLYYSIVYYKRWKRQEGRGGGSQVAARLLADVGEQLRFILRLRLGVSSTSYAYTWLIPNWVHF